MKRFKIFKSDSTSEIIEADRVEYIKQKDGLFLKFFCGRKISLKFNGIVCLLEITPEIKPAVKSIDDDED